MLRREFLECLLVLHERKLYHALGFSSTFHYAAHTFGIELSYRCKRWWPTRKQIRRLALAALILVIVGFVGLWILTFTLVGEPRAFPSVQELFSAAEKPGGPPRLEALRLLPAARDPARRALRPPTTRRRDRAGRAVRRLQTIKVAGKNERLCIK